MTPVALSARAYNTSTGVTNDPKDCIWLSESDTPFVLRLHGSARYAYAVAEASLGDVIGCITQHRVRFQLSLEHHPLANLAAPPIACQVLEIVKAEAACFRLVDHTGSLLLAPWTFVTDRIAARAVASCNDAGWPAPTQR